MAWGFRKFFGLGKVAGVTVSKRSVGVSAGKRGARVPVNTRGEKGVSLNQGGFFWRKRG